ncbi:MAG: cation:proton antiporter [Candidatus Heimdallarchaeota archaeon]
MDINEIMIVLFVLLFIGVISAYISEKFKFPRVTIIVVLGLVVGTLGRVFGIIDLDSIPNYVSPAIKIVLIIVLFYGGLSIDIEDLSKVLRPGILLATVGALITAFIIGISMNILFNSLFVVGGGLILALILGALLAPNDPVAVFSAIETSGLSETPNTIAKMESGLDDTMVTTLVLAVFIPMVAAWNGGVGNSIIPLSDINDWIQGSAIFLWLTVSAVILGVLFGFLTYSLLVLLNDEDSNIKRLLTIAMAIFAFVFAESFLGSIFLPSSGYVVVFTQGVIIARKYPKTHRKEYDSVISMWAFAFRLSEIFAFVILGALVNIDAILFGSEGNIPLLIPGLFLTLLLIFITRPIDVSLMTYKTDLTWPEKIYIMFVALKGLDPAVLVIATVAFYQDMLDVTIDVSYLIDLTFSVIVLMTILQSLILFVLFGKNGYFTKKSNLESEVSS